MQLTFVPVVLNCIIYEVNKTSSFFRILNHMSENIVWLGQAYVAV